MIMTAFKFLSSKLSNQYYLVKNKKKDIIIMRSVTLNKNTHLSGYSKICKNTKINNTKIGTGSYISQDCILNNCAIGSFCSIGPQVQVIYGRHPVRTFVSTHPAFFSLRKQAGFTFVTEQKYQEYKTVDSQYSVIIGSDVWIGHNASILEGVTIGDGAIIGASALITKDIEPYSINVGSPSRVIGYRFDKQKRDFLLKFRWWDKDINWLKDHSAIFQDVEVFFEEFNTGQYND